MLSTKLAATLSLSFVLAGVLPMSGTDEAWLALRDAVPHNRYPARGRFQRAPAPDYTEQLTKLNGVMDKARSTKVEPITLFYRANTLFTLKRFAEAKVAFEDLRTRFADHGLCTSLDGESPSEVDRAIADCESEIEIAKTYEAKELPEAKLDATDRAILHTSVGDIEIAFYASAAPKTVANFKKLVKSGFFNRTQIHHVMSLRSFELGCPNTKPSKPGRSDDGHGSPGYDLPLELNTALHRRGAVSMKRLAGTDRVHGSIFTVCSSDQPALNNVQAVFATVVRGLNVVREITQSQADDDNNPYEAIIIEGVELVSGPMRRGR